MEHRTNAVPLARFNLFRTHSLDEAREQVGRVFCPHRLTIAGERARFRTVQNHVDAGLLSLSYIDYGADVEIEPGELGSFYLIQIPLAGAASIHTGARRFTANRGKVSILNPTHYTSMKWWAGCRKIQVQVAKQVLDAFAADYFGRDFDHSLDFDPAMDLSRPDCADWVRHVMAFTRFVERGGDSRDMTPRRDFHAAELLRELVEAQVNSHSHFSMSRPGGPVPRYLKTAIDYIHAHADAPLTCNDIARASGVAGRTLQNGFQHYLGKTPMKALREERLNRCRLDFILADSGDSVSETASRWGFNHPGRFSHYYKTQFGEAPSKTARGSASRM